MTSHYPGSFIGFYCDWSACSALFTYNYEFTIEGAGHKYVPMLFQTPMWLTEKLATSPSAGATRSLVLAAHYVLQPSSIQ